MEMGLSSLRNDGSLVEMEPSSWQMMVPGANARKFFGKPWFVKVNGPQVPQENHGSSGLMDFFHP
jgi:hypothetical protein